MMNSKNTDAIIYVRVDGTQTVKTNYRLQMRLIKDKQYQRFVYVFPKFVLGDNQKLKIELKELKGSRNLILRKNL